LRLTLLLLRLKELDISQNIDVFLKAVKQGA
jgi:hypothetical protein